MGSILEAVRLAELEAPTQKLMSDSKQGKVDSCNSQQSTVGYAWDQPRHVARSKVSALSERFYWARRS